MSTFIVRCLCPHYEDYDPYGIERNAVVGFPDMWPEEKYAEGALWEEHKRMREEYDMLRRLGKYVYASNEENTVGLPVAVRALISIAKENHWQVKNADAVKRLQCSTVYAIPPAKGDDEPMPTRWRDIVRWMDRKLTKEESEAVEAERRKAEREAQRRRDDRITIDAQLLNKIMGDDAPFVVMEGTPFKTVIKAPKNRKDLQAMVCAMLAEDNGWKMNDPRGYRGIAPRIYKTA